MKGRTVLRQLIASALVVAACYALPPTIGIATAVGPFLVNSNPIEGNANLSEGSQLKTGKASSQVFLQNGATLTLGIDSAASVYRDHMVLQQGATKVDNMSGFHVMAGDYRIEQQAPGSQAIVRLNDNLVEIGALTGSLNVFNQKGALLTHIGTGTAASFQTDTNSGDENGNGQGKKKRGATNGPTPNVNTNIRYMTLEAILLGTSLAGLGLAVAAIAQSSPTSR